MKQSSKINDTDIVYPIIERVVNKVYQQRHVPVDRDEIGWLLLKDKVARPVIMKSIGRKNFTEKALWDKSANYVDSLNADITSIQRRKHIRNQYAIELASTLEQKRVKRLHPFTKKLREVYALIPTTHSLDDDAADDVDDVLIDNTLSKTEKEQLTRARLGQGKFRDGLIKYWKQCAVTKCKERSLLRASHIKPWRDSNNQERLDTFNGLLLVPNLDAAFDRKMITFNENGQIQISSSLSKKDAQLLGINSSLKLIKLDKRHEKYMKYHREEFSKGETLREKSSA